jgi:hypothetical protein
MKNIVYKFLFLFYSYYDKGSTKSIAYQSSIIALIMTLFLNIFSVIISMGLAGKYLKNSVDLTIWHKYIIGFVIFIPIYWLLKTMFKKEDVLKIEMTESNKKKGYFIIIVYIIFSIMMLILSIKSK